jgi:hypothetical protein
MRKKSILFYFIFATCVLLVSACSAPGAPTGGSSLTPLEVLQKSADAMKQLKAAHIELQIASSTQGRSLGSGTPTASGNVNLNIKGSGDEALPDQEELRITVNQKANMAEVVQDGKVYLQNATGQWYVLDKSAVEGSVGNPFAGINLDQNSLLALIQHAQIVDHGDESLNNVSLRHISAALDKQGIKQLLQDNPQLAGQIGQQNVDTLLTSATSFQSSIDVWIDESQFYVHRTQLKLNLQANTSAIQGTPTAAGPVPAASVTTALDSVVDLSKFNENITITPPTDAIPTSDPGSVFGSIT